jgi:MFS family permease
MLKLQREVVSDRLQTRSPLTFFKPTKPTDAACIAISETIPVVASAKTSKEEIRNSLKASTLDHIFATLFSCVTADVLLSNFLLQLGATSVEIGFLVAIPMLANFLQPLGAYFADKANSRHWYSVQVFGPARLLWLILVLGIIGFETGFFAAHQLIQWTLLIVLAAHTCGAMGSASWLSWMAVLVPQRLRGRYFGLRNSAAQLTNLLCVPLLGIMISRWQGGSIQGYALVLTLAVVAGLISLSFQSLMTDINPQQNNPNSELISSSPPSVFTGLLKDTNFLKYLLYYGLWMFAVNLSLPFFNVYLLKDLGFEIGRVTIYTSLSAGANVLMLLWWGKLADRIGNRPILLVVGLIVAAIPLLWLGIGTDTLSVWLLLPLLYLLLGGAGSAIELCSNNLQMTIAHCKKSSNHFAIAAAASGLGGALGTTVGGFLAQWDAFGGMSELFVLSSILRLVALLPLILILEPKRQTLAYLLSRLLPLKKAVVPL